MDCRSNFYLTKLKSLQDRGVLMQLFQKHDPIDRILKQKNYSTQKKIKYLINVVKNASGQVVKQKVYDVFVKSGQVNNIVPDDQDKMAFIDQSGIIHNVAERPRAINGSTQIGLIQCQQGIIFELQKMINPSFVQGLTKKDFKKLIKKHVHSGMKSVSKDGSAFQGNQKYPVRTFMVSRKMPFYRRILQLLLKQWQKKNPNIFTKPLQFYMQYAEFSLMQYQNFAIIHFPGINQQHDDKMLRAIRYSDQRFKGLQNLLVIPFRGGTPSGDATGTTLINTDLSDSYQLLYLAEVILKMPQYFYKRLGMSQQQYLQFYNQNLQGNVDVWNYVLKRNDQLPIMSKKFWQKFRIFDIQFRDLMQIFYMQSGDDTTVFLLPQLVDTYVSVVKSRTSAKKQQQIAVGCGQVIKHKDIKISSFDDIDFCSKITFSNGDMQSWNCYRNPLKTLMTKQFYFKKNAKIFKNPAIHPFAILCGIKCQKISTLLQDVLQYRVRRYNVSQISLNAQQLQYIDQKLQYMFVDDQEVGYQFQQQINDMLNLSIGDFWNLVVNGSLSLQAPRKVPVAKGVQLDPVEFFYKAAKQKMENRGQKNRNSKKRVLKKSSSYSKYLGNCSAAKSCQQWSFKERLCTELKSRKDSRYKKYESDGIQNIDKQSRSCSYNQRITMGFSHLEFMVFNYYDSQFVS